MRIRGIIGLSIILLTATACPSSGNQQDIRKVQNNGMNLPDLQKDFYEGINFMVSDLLREDYGPDYVMKDDYYARQNYNLNVHFSIEVFDANDVDVMRFTFEHAPKEDVEVVHQYYAYKRQEGLEEPFVSEVKSLAGFDKARIQTITDQSDYYYEPLVYQQATIQRGERFYVFQFISNESSMAYLYDDFIVMLNSVS